MMQFLIFQNLTSVLPFRWYSMQEAHETGVAMVIACPQDQAEEYCESLRLNGLTSTIEA